MYTVPLPEHCTEEDGEYDEPPVPDVLVVDGGDPEEHEDDRLRAARQHLHRVLYRCLRFTRDISLNVVLYIIVLLAVHNISYYRVYLYLSIAVKS